MKKLLCCLLAAFLLSGCGIAKGKNEINKKPEVIIEPALSEIGEAKREDSFLVLRFTINPDFELFLDEEGFITKVRCLNEDAEALFADLDVLGQDYYTAVDKLLNTAMEKAFITAETDKIQIQTSIVMEIEADQEVLEDLAANLAQPVEAFQADNDLPFSVVSKTPVVENPIEEESNDMVSVGKPNSAHETDIYDQSGKTVIGKHTEYYDEKGHHAKDTWEYYGDSIYTKIYADGYVKESTLESEDGSITRRTLYRPDGTKISTEENNPRCSSTTLYNEADLPISCTQVYTEGWTETHTYHNNGKLASQHQENATDGSYRHSTYDENGHFISDVQAYDDGYKYEATYYPGTNIVQKICTTDPNMGGYTEEYFDEKGTPTMRISTWDDGVTDETTFHVNGNTAIIVSTGSDFARETRYDENGNKIYSFYKDPIVEYVIENDAFTYYLQDGEPVTDAEYLQKLYDLMKAASG